jgi:hypothetical protein
MLVCGYDPGMTDRIAIAASVDLLVVGGSLAAVSCALAARRAGLSVFIAAPLTGLGDDVFAHLLLRPGEPVGDALAAAVFPGGGCPSPLHAKRTCEQAVVDAGVRLLLNVLPCGVVRDADGALCGVVLAHRGGRSVVTARAIVDAGRLAPVARQAGIAFDAFAGGRIAVETRLLGVDGATCGGTDLGQADMPSARELQHYTQSKITPPSSLQLAVRTVELDLPDLSVDALLGLESRLQLAAFQPAARGMSELGRYVAPVGVAGGRRVSTWTGAADVDLTALATSEPRLHILSGAADCTRAVAARLHDPAALSAVGERLGARLASSLPPAATAVAAGLGGPAIDLDLRGSCGGFRPLTADLPGIAIDDRHLPVIAEVDVMVVGGGTGGAPAGIAAAREGARTLVLERLHRLGGVGTLGRIARYWFGNRAGFTAEVDRRVFTAYGEARFPAQQGAWWALEHKQDAWLRMLGEAGGRCWYTAQAVAAAMRGDRVAGALVATIHGAGLVRCAAAVDATGSADLAAAAGAPCRVTDASHVAVQGTGLPAVDPRTDYQNSDHDFCDDADAEDATRMLVRSRAKFAGHWDVGPHIDSRERRQIRGRYELTPLDICCDRTFPDAVVRATSNFDSHGFTVHPVFTAHPMDKKPLWSWIPYRCLLPQAIDGVLVTGLGMSAHRDALPVVRMQPDVQNAGFSAGVAAAMAARQGLGTAQVDLAALQQRLIALGHLPAEVQGLRDSFPLPADRLADLVGNRLVELIGTAAAFAEPAAAAPLLRIALADPDRRERAAVILGLQGDTSAVPVLRTLLADAAWDAGWRFTGMHQFGASLSPVDVRLVALAHCGTAEDLAVVAALAARLDDDPAFSHVRALAWSATELARRFPAIAAQAAAILGIIHARPGLAGHAITSLAQSMTIADADPINTREREVALRELHLAAALVRCGDVDDRGHAALRAYAADLRGHFARHASAVLAEASAI